MSDKSIYDAIPYIEKASILLLTVGEEAAANILKQLGPKEVQRIGTSMATLSDVKRERVAAVFNAFIAEITNTTGFGIGADSYVRNMLTRALGAEKASGIIDRILLGGNTQGLDTLKWMDARAISDVVNRSDIKCSSPSMISRTSTSSRSSRRRLNEIGPIGVG